MRGALFVAVLLSSGAALADGHGVTVQNGTGETIRSVVISASAGSGENRLRSTLPPGAVGRIAYNTGCQANVRIGFEGGRTEDHGGVDVCSDPRIVAGTDGVAGPAGVAGGGRTGGAVVGPGVTKAASKGGAVQPAVAPLPVVPPWTGRSITKRFGGME